MRTPNTQCLLCGKPIYRRPFELSKVRYAACMEHRSQAQKVAGITPKQLDGLSRGRVKGTNHRAGYTHKPESRAKASQSHKDWCAAHPERVAARGLKTRAENHYKWTGGISKLNKSIRLMTEHRRWMISVRERDGKCLRCGSTECLESHHLTPLCELIQRHGIKTREDARACADFWDLTNGETLCRPCHYAEHGRRLP